MGPVTLGRAAAPPVPTPFRGDPMPPARWFGSLWSTRFRRARTTNDSKRLSHHKPPRDHAFVGTTMRSFRTVRSATKCLRFSSVDRQPQPARRPMRPGYSSGRWSKVGGKFKSVTDSAYPWMRKEAEVASPYASPKARVTVVSLRVFESAAEASTSQPSDFHPARQTFATGYAARSQ
jgi:hypothetical protein